jgi:hypothetical protein
MFQKNHFSAKKIKSEGGFRLLMDLDEGENLN